MNIYFHELRTYRKSTIVWIISLAAITLMFLSIYPTFTKDVAASKRLIESLPLAVRQGLGISINNFFTIYGLLSYLYVYVLLAGAIQAMNLGVGVLSKEMNGKTADFLLSKPISRTSVLAQKYFAAFTLIVITNSVYIMLSYGITRMYERGPINARIFLLISATLFFVQLIFLSLGILFSIIIPKIKSIISITLPTVFSFFIIGAIGAIIGNQTVRYITPFKYFDTNYIIANSTYEIKYLALEMVLIILMILVSFYLFIHKDIRASS